MAEYRVPGFHLSDLVGGKKKKKVCDPESARSERKGYGIF